ncbi:MAG: hypothetical protein U9M95_06830 [Candidatus Altiarchaeota archaeon]|nr:hypothetical protein [Candidatus Altiarchaeota archaeon]
MNSRRLIGFILAAYVMLFIDLLLIYGFVKFYFLFVGGFGACYIYLFMGVMSILSFPSRSRILNGLLSSGDDPIRPCKSNYWSWRWIKA